MTTPPSAHTAKVVIERIYRADVNDVWDLWTTKNGFESWWGPPGFRVEVHQIDARISGALGYDMIADTAETIGAMEEMGVSTSHSVRSRFSVFEPHTRLVLTNVIDFLPGVASYESDIAVDFSPTDDGATRMVVTLDGMHDEQHTRMQQEGFTSQLTKLDGRFGETNSQRESLAQGE